MSVPVNQITLATTDDIETGDRVITARFAAGVRVVIPQNRLLELGRGDPRLAEAFYQHLASRLATHVAENLSCYPLKDGAAFYRLDPDIFLEDSERTT